MPYGKTIPAEYVCSDCGVKMYGSRLNKTMAKMPIRKFCNNCDEVGMREFKPKECKHSS